MTEEHKEKIREAAKARSEAKKLKALREAVQTQEESTGEQPVPEQKVFETTKIKEVKLTYIVPPPVYRDHLTTDKSNNAKQIGLVSEITRKGDVIVIKPLTGQTLNIPMFQVQYFVEE